MLACSDIPDLVGFDSQARDPVEVTIRSHDEMTTTNVVRRSDRGLHGPSQETKLKLQLLLASLRSKCAATPEGAAGAAISIPRGMSARGIN